MVSCFAPNIVTLQAEAVCRDEMRGKRKGRMWRADQVKDRQSRSYVFDLHIVGDDVALDSCLKS